MTERFEDRRVYWVWLGMVFGAGNQAIWQLCRGYEHIYEFAGELRDGRLDGRLTQAQRERRSLPFEEAAALIGRCENEGIKVLSFRSEGFPQRLRTIPEPPAVLFLRGDEKAAAPDRPSVLFVGSRTPTAYSVRIAEYLAGELAERGVSVITGLENGIDAVSGEAAAEKGCAVAVCGRGILSDHYAPEQTGKISSHGAVIAEYTDSAEYGRVAFDKRNRLLCGLADAVVFIECRSDSFGLNNVTHAKRLGRPLLAVPPADICDARYFGQRDLLRAGAGAVYSPEDILSAIGKRGAVLGSDGKELDKIGRNHPSKPKKAPPEGEKVTERRINTKNEQKNVDEGLHKSEMSATIDMSGFSESEKQLYEVICGEGKPIHINRLADITGKSIPQLVQELTMLRLEGAVTELSGKRYVKS